MSINWILRHKRKWMDPFSPTKKEVMEVVGSHWILCGAMASNAGCFLHRLPTAMIQEVIPPYVVYISFWLCNSFITTSNLGMDI